jgi:putative ABC transport system permease protein
MIPLRYNLRSLAVRKTTTLAAGGGVALVVFVFSASLMLSNGIEKTLGRSGRSDVAIVLRQGANAELESAVEDSQASLILASKEVARGPNGQPLGVGELVVVLALDKLGTDGGISNVTVRGVPDQVTAFRPAIRIVAGRAAKPGTDEVIVGKGIRGRFRGVDIGQSFDLRKNRPLRVVGVFEDEGSSYESEVWADLNVARSSLGRDAYVSSVRARLTSPAAFDAFKLGIEQNRQLGLKVTRETDYYLDQSKGTVRFIQVVGMLIAAFFSIGAMIGATITMHASVANRHREVGTLRALGFTRASVLLGFLIESATLGVAGGLVGALASLGTRFLSFPLVNMVSWSEVSFSFEPTAGIVMGSLAFAAVMGLLGGFLPALRAARLSPVAAMHE